MKTHFTRSIILATVCLIFSVPALFAVMSITQSDLESIDKVLTGLADAIVTEDIDTVMSFFSPTMSSQKRSEIERVMSSKFKAYDYQTYSFDSPNPDRVKVLESGRVARIKAHYYETYRIGTGARGSSDGLTAQFLMRQINGRWLIEDTDFYSKKNIAKWALIAFGLLVCVIIMSTVFWVMMLIDLLRRNFTKSDEKMIWVIVLIFTGIIGALLYYLMVRRQPRHEKL